jgi:hypothetical protein
MCGIHAVEISNKGKDFFYHKTLFMIGLAFVKIYPNASTDNLLPTLDTTSTQMNISILQITTKH